LKTCNDCAWKVQRYASMNGPWYCRRVTWSGMCIGTRGAAVTAWLGAIELDDPACPALDEGD
jgi:hypothetical protein